MFKKEPTIKEMVKEIIQELNNAQNSPGEYPEDQHVNLSVGCAEALKKLKSLSRKLNKLKKS
jgi:hypothetical protein